MKKYITAKRLIILSVVILSVFAIINVAWLFLRYIPYHRCREKMDVIDNHGLISYGKVKIGRIKYNWISMGMKTEPADCH